MAFRPVGNPLLLLAKAIIRGGAADNLFATPVHVDGYTTKDGTYVAPHTAMRRKHIQAPPAAASHGMLDLFSVRHPDPAPAPAVAAPPPLPVAVEVPLAALVQAHAIVEHVTRRGKTLRGIVRQDMSHAEAKAVDEYTFKKDGGWFIRERHLAGPSTADSAAPAPDTAKEAVKDVFGTAQADVTARRKQADKMRAVADSLGSRAQESM